MPAPGSQGLHSRGRRPSCGLGLLFLVACGGEAPRAEATPIQERTQRVAVEGFRTVTVAAVGLDLAHGAPLVVLHAGWDQVLPIWIGEPEAAAILQVLDGETPPRPMTHDLVGSLLDALGSTLLEARVTALENATYLGELMVGGMDGSHSVDARPSDAIALALRAGAPVRVAEMLWADLPDVGFLSVGRGPEIARLRGLTVRGTGGVASGLEVLHVDPLEAGRGMAVGDRILRVEGRTVRSPSEWVQVLRARGAEATVDVDRERDGVIATVRLPARRGPPVSG